MNYPKLHYIIKIGDICDSTMKFILKYKIHIILILLFIITISYSYAYFEATVGDTASTNMKTYSLNSQSLKFYSGNPFNLNISYNNLDQGMNNLTSSTITKAVLTPDGKTGEGEDTYGVYFLVQDNEFVYSTDEKTPEIILRITDPYGYPVTEIEEPFIDLTYDETMQGFDITELRHSICIFTQYPIQANDFRKTTQEWQFELEFVNLDTDQSINIGKKFNTDTILSNANYKENLMTDEDGQIYTYLDWFGNEPALDMPCRLFVELENVPDGVEPHYQWQYSEDGENYISIEGENTDEYNLIMTYENYMNYYRCLVTYYPNPEYSYSSIEPVLTRQPHNIMPYS